MLTTTNQEHQLVLQTSVYLNFLIITTVLSGVMMRLINVETGVFTEKQLADIVRPTNIHFPRCSLVCIENTTNLGGGKAWPLDTVAAVSAWAHSHCLKLHMDGARIWNASIATGVPEKHYAALCDSVSVCFSKAPTLAYKFFTVVGPWCAYWFLPYRYKGFH